MPLLRFKHVTGLFISLVSACSLTLAQPRIDSVSGSPADGATLTITGVNFGAKSPAAPKVYASCRTSLNPDGPSIARAWNSVENMAWSSDNGGTCKASTGVAPDGNSLAWGLELTDTWVATAGSSFVYTYRRQMANFTASQSSQNQKDFRIWADNGKGGNATPDAGAHNYEGAFIVELEQTVGGYCTGDFNPNMALSDTNWHAEEYFLRGGTACGSGGGQFSFRRDGALKCNVSGFNTCSSATGSKPLVRNYVFLMENENMVADPWNPAWSNNNRVWAKDIYGDMTWARVMVCSEPTYATCTDPTIQLPTAWGPGSITVTLNQGGLASLAGKYLYVFDSSNTVNPSGFQLTSTAGVQTPAHLTVQ